jgi:transposase
VALYTAIPDSDITLSALQELLRLLKVLFLFSMPSTRCFTPFEKGQIYGLHKHAHWPLQRIATALDTTKGAVSKIIHRVESEPQTPTRKGRPPVITTRKRQRLVNRLSTDAQSRRLKLEHLAQLEGLNHHHKTIAKALDKEGYHRRIARRKPWLSQTHKEARLKWAQDHVNWSDRQWQSVLWTDEASFRCGYFGQIYVTRTAGEEFHEDCLVAKFRKYSACMIWGCISPEGIHKLLVFDKGSVNGERYRTEVVPLIQQAVDEQQASSIFQQQSIVMQDGARIHTARATLSLFRDMRIRLMDWPANSPDLNPIENIWSLLKRRVGRHFPTTREEIIAAIQLEWSQLTVSDITRCCQSMRERCQAVIDANGGHTKW